MTTQKTPAKRRHRPLHIRRAATKLSTVEWADDHTPILIPGNLNHVHAIMVVGMYDQYNRRRSTSTDPVAVVTDFADRIRRYGQPRDHQAALTAAIVKLDQMGDRR